MEGTEILFHNDLNQNRENFGKSEKVYDKWASKYDEIIDENILSTNKHAADTLSKHFHNKENVNIVDIPCGTGLTGKSLVDVGFVLIDGYDISQGMIDVAKEKGIYRNLNVGCITDTQTLGCKENCYDGIAAVGGISNGHINLKDALKEFSRVLKPNGVMVFTVHLHIGIDNLLDLLKGYLKNGQLDLISIEKRFYYLQCGNKTECYFCAMKKL